MSETLTTATSHAFLPLNCLVRIMRIIWVTVVALPFLLVQLKGKTKYMCFLDCKLDRVHLLSQGEGEGLKARTLQ